MKEERYRFRQSLEDGTSRSSIVVDGEYIFSPTEARKHRPDLVEKYYFFKEGDWAWCENEKGETI